MEGPEPDIIAFKWDKDSVILNIIGRDAKRMATMRLTKEQILTYRKKFF